MAACGVGVIKGPPLAPPEPTGPPAQAATRSATATRATRGRSRTRLDRRRGSVTWSSCVWLANRVVAAGMAGMAASDPTHPHPAPAEQAVAIDRLFRITRAGRLVAAARRQPAEEDSVEPDGTDPDHLHELV